MPDIQIHGYKESLHSPLYLCLKEESKEHACEHTATEQHRTALDALRQHLQKASFSSRSLMFIFVSGRFPAANALQLTRINPWVLKLRGYLNSTEAICSASADEKPDMCQHCMLTAPKANCSLGCINKGASRQGGDCPSLLCPCDSLPAVLCPALGPLAQERCWSAGAGPEKAMKMPRGLEHLYNGDRLRELGEVRALGRLQCSSFQYPRGA